jgi:uncharacterized protein
MIQDINELKAVELLKKYAGDRNSLNKVLAHSRKVQEIALRHAVEIPGTDVDFIRSASLLHDIGRLVCSVSLRHGIEGAEIVRSEGIDERYALVCERHLGSGINREDIREQRMDLPDKDYMPVSIEEKIITDADNLTFGSREGTMVEVLKRFQKELGKKGVERARRLHEEIIVMMDTPAR